MIGSIRRECLDHLIVWNERSLRRYLQQHIAYYKITLRQVRPPRRGRSSKRYMLEPDHPIPSFPNLEHYLKAHEFGRILCKTRTPSRSRLTHTKPKRLKLALTGHYLEKAPFGAAF